MKSAVLCLIAGFVTTLSSCAYNEKHETHVRNASLETGQCTVHHVQLKKARCYRFDCYLLPESKDCLIVAYQHFPNALPTGFRDNHGSCSHIILYCPECESELVAYMEKHAKAQK